MESISGFIGLKSRSGYSEDREDRMVRHQKGHIFRKGGNWYGRWWDDVIVNGRIVRKQRCEKLAEVSDRYRSRADVRRILAEKLGPVNAGRARPASIQSVQSYFEDCYLPYVEENFKPSTFMGYRTLWETYIKSLVGDISVRDFRTVNAASLLLAIHRKHEIGRTTLKHIKSLLSGMFTYAKNQGLIDGVNPIQDAMIPRQAASPEETHAASPLEVLAIMSALEKAGEQRPVRLLR